MKEGIAMKRTLFALAALLILLLGASLAPNAPHGASDPGADPTASDPAAPDPGASGPAAPYDYSDALGANAPNANAPNANAHPPVTEASYDYLTFEEALAEFATDVVVASYVQRQPFGRNLTEFEFLVQERVLGNAADRIFVYAENINTDVGGIGVDVAYRPGDLVFVPGTDYMLVLGSISSPYAKTHDDGFVFIRNIVVDLDDPSNSIMYNESLSLHSSALEFDGSTSRQSLISHVSDLTRNNRPARGFIKSEAVEDIVNESPHIWVVEVGNALRLSTEQITADWMETDLYYCTVVQVLKGDKDIGFRFVMTFFADTVRPGEQHVIAVEPLREGSTWYQFSSRNSIFHINEIEKLLSALDQ